MEGKTNSDNDASSMKVKANQVVSDSQENKSGIRGTTNGHAGKDEENHIIEKVTATSSSSSEEPAAGPSSGDTKSTETVSLAMQHLAAGKRDLVMSDLNAAVTSLALACELLGKHYGETAFECGEAYYYYGKALLDLARQEGGVIDTINGDSESEKNKEEGQAETPDSTGNIDEENEKLNNETTNSEDKEISPVKETEDTDEDVQEDEEEPSNLQLSWEMLELAKSILMKQAESIQVVNAADDTEAEEKARLKSDVENRVSDTFQTLGELSLENENYTQAVEDLDTCLERRQQMMPEDCRSIAETHYQLGVAQSFNLQFDEAVTSLKGAISVLQIRIDRLKSKTESVDPSKAKDAICTRENEIKEIESLIPEINEKIVDTKDMKTETIKKLVDKKITEEGIAANLGSGNTESLSGGSSKVASTISSSFIKKRPATDAVTTDAKKMHLEMP